MKFIRDDGKVYNPKHTDTIKRLDKSDRFKRLDKATAEELKTLARKREISGYSTLRKEELISALEEGG